MNTIADGGRGSPDSCHTLKGGRFRDDTSGQSMHSHTFVHYVVVRGVVAAKRKPFWFDDFAHLP